MIRNSIAEYLVDIAEYFVGGVDQCNVTTIKLIAFFVDGTRNTFHQFLQ